MPLLSISDNCHPPPPPGHQVLVVGVTHYILNLVLTAKGALGSKKYAHVRLTQVWEPKLRHLY